MEERTAGRGFLILSVAGILGKLLSALYVPLLTGIIGDNGYGIYSVGYDIFIFLFAISSLGAQPAITKVVAELRAVGNHKDALRALKLSRNYLALAGGVLTVLFMFIAFPFANLISRPDSALSFVFLAPAIVLAAILAAYRGYMQGIEDMHSLAISQVLEQLVNVILSLVFAALLVGVSVQWGSAGGTIGTSLGALVAIVYIIYIYEKRNYEDEAIENHNEGKKSISDKKIIRKLVMYGLPITLVAGVQNFAGVVDVITVGKSLKAAGFDGVAINEYSAVLGYYKVLLYVPLTIVTALGTSIFPRIIQAFVHKDKKDLKKQTKYAFRITYMIVIPATLGLALLSKEIYAFLFPGAGDGYKLVMYGSIVLVFMSITSIQNVILQGINKFYLIIGTASLGIAFKVIFNVLLVRIPDINIVGAVIGTFFSFLIPAIINHIKLQKFFKVRIPVIGQAIIPLISSIIMGGVIYAFKSPVMRMVNIMGGGRVLNALAVVILISIGGVIYLYAMVFLNGINKRDLDMISPQVYRLLPRHLRRKIKK